MWDNRGGDGETECCGGSVLKRSAKSDTEHKLCTRTESDHNHVLLADVCVRCDQTTIGRDGRTPEKGRSGDNGRQLAFEPGDLIIARHGADIDGASQPRIEGRSLGRAGDSALHPARRARRLSEEPRLSFGEVDRSEKIYGAWSPVSRRVSRCHESLAKNMGCVHSHK